MSAEEFAILFYETNARLGPQFVTFMKGVPLTSWQDLSAEYKSLMIATSRVVLEELRTKLKNTGDLL